MNKRLIKSNNKMFAGVLAGIAEYFDVDPTLVRLAYAFFTFVSFGLPAIAAYIAMCFIIPDSNNNYSR